MPRALLSGTFAPALALTLLAACNPYDPDLGKTPFRCGMSDPVCPDGYACNASGVCVQDLSDVDASTQFSCSDDGMLEPNDMHTRAFVTPIPGASMMYSLLGMALCPAGDVDHYQFGVTQNGTNLEAQVVSVAGRTPLELNLLTTSGAVIATGISDAATPQKVRLEVSNRLAAGSYVIQVKTPDMTENNYDIVIKTCVEPLPCP